MSLTYSSMLDLQTDLISFNLPNVVTDQNFSNSDLDVSKPSIIMFICNHCPYVIHYHEEIIKLVNDFKNDINLIFTSPNADPGNDEIFEAITSFVRKNRHRSSSFKSLGHLRYFSLLNYVDGVIGNSSSGITEAPAFNIGTINIGHRQTGRIKGESIIDCASDALAIEYAINKLYSKNFQSIIKDIKSPYGDGTASLKILDTISKISIKDNIIKSFYDINR